MFPISMEISLYLFLALAAVLWVSSFGYVLLLWCVARKRRPVAASPADCPPVTVVIPVLDEEQRIDRKLDNLRELDYPADRIEVVVVDGSSRDATVRRIRDRVVAGESIRLIEMAAQAGKAAQINRVFDEIDDTVTILTDADAVLEPSCLSQLVGHLESEPRTGIVGAVVNPETGLLEEHVHWSFLDLVWWLEGEVFSAAGLSGVCHAVRPAAFTALRPGADADDIHLALQATSRGYDVRVCPTARATELRVPQTVRDFLHFRRYRGRGYLTELSASFGSTPGMQGWRIVQCVRRWQMIWVPPLAILCGGVGCVLLASAWRLWVAAVPAWFLLSLFMLTGAARRFAEPGLDMGSAPRWGWASMRWVCLTILSLLLLKIPPDSAAAGRAADSWSAFVNFVWQRPSPATVCARSTPSRSKPASATAATIAASIARVPCTPAMRWIRPNGSTRSGNWAATAPYA